MDAPTAVVLVAHHVFPQLDAFVSENAMDVVQVNVSGLPGFAFWNEDETNTVVQFLQDNHTNFRLLKDATPDMPTEAPPNSPER